MRFIYNVQLSLNVELTIYQKGLYLQHAMAVIIHTGNAAESTINAWTAIGTRRLQDRLKQSWCCLFNLS